MNSMGKMMNGFAAISAVGLLGACEPVTRGNDDTTFDVENDLHQGAILEQVQFEEGDQGLELLASFIFDVRQQSSDQISYDLSRELCEEPWIVEVAPDLVAAPSLRMERDNIDDCSGLVADSTWILEEPLGGWPDGWYVLTNQLFEDTGSLQRCDFNVEGEAVVTMPNCE